LAREARRPGRWTPWSSPEQASCTRSASSPPAPTIAAQYFGVRRRGLGLNGFIFRSLPLSGWFSLPVFSAAVFGALFLVGYFFQSVAGPFLIDSGGPLHRPGPPGDLIFYAFALMTILGAAGCAFSRNIIYSAWSLLFAFMGVAGLYVFLGADFPAVAQVLIYVGGILVLILFAIHAHQADRRGSQADQRAPGAASGRGAGRVTVGTLSYMAVDGALEADPGAELPGGERRAGRRLPHRLPPAVRGRLRGAAGRTGRRASIIAARKSRTSDHDSSNEPELFRLPHFLIVGAALFALGMVTVVTGGTRWDPHWGSS